MPACRSGASIVVAALISGALAGLAGAGEVGGVRYQVTSDLSSGYGYAGIVIATLAELNPLGAIPPRCSSPSSSTAPAPWRGRPACRSISPT